MLRRWTAQETIYLLVSHSRQTNPSGTSWIIVNPKWKNSSIFEGRKIVTIPDLVYREFQLDAFTEQEIQA